jgi:Fe-S cluster biogenesis protein NfuA
MENTSDESQTTAVLSDADRAERLDEVRKIIEMMRPAVQADGGDLVLLSVDTEAGIVEVQLQGACSSCAVSASTLQGGVERILKGRLDWVVEVIGGIDEEEDFAYSASLGTGGWTPKSST